MGKKTVFEEAQILHIVDKTLIHNLKYTQRPKGNYAHNTKGKHDNRISLDRSSQLGGRSYNAETDRNSGFEENLMK